MIYALGILLWLGIEYNMVITWPFIVVLSVLTVLKGLRYAYMTSKIYKQQREKYIYESIATTQSKIRGKKYQDVVKKNKKILDKYNRNNKSTV